jgi:hypothetical protein
VNANLAEFHRKIAKVYGKGNMKKGSVLWGGTDVHTDVLSERPSVVTDDLKDGVDAHFRENT